MNGARVDVRPYSPTRQAQPLPGAKIIGLRGKDEFEVAKSINDGLSTATVGRLARTLGVTEGQILRIVDIPESTYHSRKRRKRPLTADESSRVYRIAKVAASAEEFFEGDNEAARRWLVSPKLALGGKTPLEFARTPEGSDYVVMLLTRMAHGVVS